MLSPGQRREAMNRELAFLEDATEGTARKKGGSVDAELEE